MAAAVWQHTRGHTSRQTDPTHITDAVTETYETLLSNYFSPSAVVAAVIDVTAAAKSGTMKYLVNTAARI